MYRTKLSLVQITILSVIYIFHILFLVSVLALEEYSTLQQKYALESQCRFEAEKYAAEVSDFVLRHFRFLFLSSLHALHSYDPFS